MFYDLIPLAVVVVLVPLVALIIFRLLAKTKRTRRPLNNVRINDRQSQNPSRLSR